MLKQYLINTYCYLVRVGAWDLEPVDGSTKRSVPESYHAAVAERLVEA